LMLSKKVIGEKYCELSQLKITRIIITCTDMMIYRGNGNGRKFLPPGF